MIIALLVLISVVISIHAYVGISALNSLKKETSNLHKSAPNAPVAQSYCGDGIQGKNEVCDDGNTNNGDGCSSACQCEPASNFITNIGNNTWQIKETGTSCDATNEQYAVNQAAGGTVISIGELEQ